MFKNSHAREILTVKICTLRLTYCISYDVKRKNCFRKKDFLQTNLPFDSKHIIHFHMPSEINGRLLHFHKLLRTRVKIILFKFLSKVSQNRILMICLENISYEISKNVLKCTHIRDFKKVSSYTICKTLFSRIYKYYLLCL